METFAVEMALPLGVTDVGDIVHVDAAGAPPQLRETSWEKPPAGVTDNDADAVPPAGTVAETGETDTEKSVPVPVSASLCGLPAALLVTVMLADRAPTALGVKVALKVQLAPPARLPAPNGQGEVPVAESTKSPA
jgi:hypothetical protein